MAIHTLTLVDGEPYAILTKLDSGQWEVTVPAPDVEIDNDERCIVDTLDAALRSTELLH